MRKIFAFLTTVVVVAASSFARAEHQETTKLSMINERLSQCRKNGLTLRLPLWDLFLVRAKWIERGWAIFESCSVSVAVLKIRLETFVCTIQRVYVVASSVILLVKAAINHYIF